MKIISLYKKHTSYFLYGAFWLAILLWMGYGYVTKYDRMLEEPTIYLNLDGSFKSEKVKGLEKNKKELFWKHQLNQIDKRLDSLRRVEIRYKEDVLASRVIRDRLILESHQRTLQENLSSTQRSIVEDSFQVNKLKQQAEDLDTDNGFKLAIRMAQEDIPQYETLRQFILFKLVQK